MKTSPFHPFRSAQARAEYHALYKERAKAWPVPSETRLIETPTGQTFVRTSGHITDPPLVLLPGSRGTSLTWIPNIAALSARFRTHAPDSIFDYGLSIRRRELKTPDDLLTWLDEVLTALVPEGPLCLAGLSYGGWLACQYAIRFPGRVQKLVLLTPAATVLPVSPILILRALLTLIPIMGFRRQFYYWLLHDSVQSGETGRAYVDEAISDWSAAERCFTSLPLIPATVLDDKTWQGFNIPTLFLVGEHEKVYSANRAVNRLNHVAPQIKAEIISQAGHDLWFVRADAVAEKILRFLCDPETNPP